MNAKAVRIAHMIRDVLSRDGKKLSPKEVVAIMKSEKQRRERSR